MSILTAVWSKSLGLPALRIPKLPDFPGGRRLSDAMEAYGRIAAIPYLVGLGLDADPPSLKGRAHDDF
jgi:hypothetical protein